MTVWRILNTTVILALGIYKIVSIYLGKTTELTIWDWVVGVFWISM